MAVPAHLRLEGGRGLNSGMGTGGPPDHLRPSGCRQGHPGVAPGRALRRAAHLHRRHAARRGGLRIGLRPPGQGDHGRRSDWCPTTSWRASSPSAWPSPTPLPGFAARRLPPDPGPGGVPPGPAGPGGRRTWPSTWTCPRRSWWSASPAAGSAGAAGPPTPWDGTSRPPAGSAPSAAERSSCATTTGGRRPQAPGALQRADGPPPGLVLRAWAPGHRGRCGGPRRHRPDSWPRSSRSGSAEGSPARL